MAPAGSSTRRRRPGRSRSPPWSRARDLAAFESVARTRLPVAFRLGCAMLGNPATAADIAQDAVVAAWRELPQLPDLTTFDDWFRRIVIDACRMELRQKAAPTPAWDDHPRGAPPVAWNPELARMVERAIRIDALEAAFERLDPDERAVSSQCRGARPATRSRSCCACRPAPPTGTPRGAPGARAHRGCVCPYRTTRRPWSNALIPPGAERADAGRPARPSMHAVAQ